MRSLFLMVTLLSTALFPHGQTSKPSSIIGEWSFVEFEYIGYLKDVPEVDKIRENKFGKGMVITFTKDGKYLCRQPGGLKQNNYKSIYRLINNGKQFIAFGDTITIRVVNQQQLKLYHSQNRPLAVFKRVK